MDQTYREERILPGAIAGSSINAQNSCSRDVGLEDPFQPRIQNVMVFQKTQRTLRCLALQYCASPNG